MRPAEVFHSQSSSPLHVLGMYGEMIGGDEGADAEMRVEASNVIRDEVERLSGLIRTLMSIARIEKACAIRTSAS